MLEILRMEKQPKEIKIGDLICYNAAGQKKNTLALVLDFREDRNSYNPGKQVLVQWCCVGNGILPRKSLSYWDGRGRDEILQPGSMCWHELGNWFEVVK